MGVERRLSPGIFSRFSVGVVIVVRSDAMTDPPVLKRAEADNGIVTGELVFALTHRRVYRLGCSGGLLGSSTALVVDSTMEQITAQRAQPPLSVRRRFATEIG